MSVSTLDGLLEIAIEHEISSQAFYREALSKTSDRQVQHFLNELVKEEEEHERLLKSVKEMEIYDGTVPVDPDLVSNAAESHTVQIREIPENPQMEDILKIALQRETRAYNIFTQMAKVTSNEDLKELFHNLAAEERGHHASIEKKFQARTGQMGYEG